MNYSVIGVQPVDFTGKDGNRVSGFNFFCTYENPNVSGLACQKIFMSSKKLSVVPDVGDTICINYNQYGRIISYEVM